MPETRGFLDIDGARLEYRLAAPARSSGTTLVFLHEGLGCVAMWKDFPDRVMHATGCPVFLYSRSGYGGSSPCRRPRPTTFMHAEGLTVLPKILDAAGIDRAIVVGHSDGASIALIHAGGTRDPRVHGLVLMAPHVFVEPLTVDSIRAIHAAYQDSALRKRLAHYHGERVDDTFLGWTDVWLDPAFLAWNIETYLPGVAVPLLLIQGEQDNYGTVRQLDAIQAQVPGGAARVLLPECGHAPFRDRPTETLQAIAIFTAGLLPPEAQAGQSIVPGPA